jgi:hypothetical protein
MAVRARFSLLGAAASAVMVAACTGNDAAVKKIDQLTQTQLAHAFCTVDALPMWAKVDKAHLPAEFSELGATHLKRTGNHASLHVSGALDDVVSLQFMNVGRTGHKKYIDLLPGERQARRTLWEAPDSYTCPKSGF